MWLLHAKRLTTAYETAVDTYRVFRYICSLMKNFKINPMMRFAKFLFLCVAVACASFAMGQDAGEDYILTIKKDGEVIDKVTLFEFENIFRKNNQTQGEVDRAELDEYLELFINFKLKVKEAEEMGMDTVRAFTRELAGYRRQLAKPYLIDSDVNEKLIREAYDRLQYDVKASHLLIKLPESATPVDTLTAWNKISSLRKRANRGNEDFGDLAKRYSEDPSAKENNGNLGYFTAFQMVYPFETAAFNTEVGSVSKIVRTRFGYHIIKVEDKRTSKGKVKVAHIMVQVTSEATEEDKANAKSKIDELYQQLDNGGDFMELARTYSDDKGSASKGGALPMFGTGRMVEEFEAAAFSIDNVGDYTKPVRTSYGWHIIKLLESRPNGSFESMENDLRNKVARDGRAAMSRNALVSKLREEYTVTVHQKAVDAVANTVGPEFFDGNWDPDVTKGMDEIVLTIHDEKYSDYKKEFTQRELANYINTGQKRKENRVNAKRDEVMERVMKDMIDTELIRFEENNLEYKYPKFRALMNEYRDGILLFELMDEKVWSKAVKDTLGLADFYETRKNNYMWEERVDATVYVCANEAIANKARKLAKKQQKKGYDSDWMLEQLNNDSQLNLRIESGKYLKHDNEYVDKTDWTEGFSENMADGEKVVFVYVKEKIAPQPKSLKEAKGLITADYQSHLEEEWIKELKAKYEVERHTKALDKIK